MAEQILNIALVGCGQIADAHLQEIGKLKNAKVVAVCDRHLDLAKQAAARFGVPQVFDDVYMMLRQVHPNVVHITTPPHTHLPLALAALGAGAHVYIEKPFTVDAREADELLTAADRASLLVCVGHDQLFDPAWQECRRLYDRGQLGKIVHVESIQGYNLEGPFGTLLSSDPNHWVHRLPGGLFQNVISHPLYKIADFLPDAMPIVQASWFGKSDRYPFPVELRVMLRGTEVSGSMTFSSAARPVQRVTRVYGTRQSVEVDFESRVVRLLTASRLPGAFGLIEAPIREMKQFGAAAAKNIWRFIRSDLQYFAGMNRLIAQFYAAIVRKSAPPIAHDEIRRVTAMMDEIFRVCREGDARRDPLVSRNAEVATK